MMADSCRWLFRGICVALAMLGLSHAAVAAGDFKQFTWELIYQLKRDIPAARGIDFVLLSGAPEITAADHRLLAEHLARLGLAGQAEAREALARYRRMRGQHFPFRADPVEIPSLGGPRHVCVLKLDTQTPHTLDGLLSFLRVERGALERAGVDVSRLSVARLQQHIASHELWHCLEMTQQEPYIRFAESLVDERLGSGQEHILPALLRNHAETGADLFATLMDMRNYGDCQMKELMIAVRAANLEQKRDVEHYTVPALALLRQEQAPALPWRTLAQLIEQVNDLRRQAMDPQAFAATYRAVNARTPSDVK